MKVAIDALFRDIRAVPDGVVLCLLLASGADHKKTLAQLVSQEDFVWTRRRVVYHTKKAFSVSQKVMAKIKIPNLAICVCEITHTAFVQGIEQIGWCKCDDLIDPQTINQTNNQFNEILITNILNHLEPQ